MSNYPSFTPPPTIAPAPIKTYRDHLREWMVSDCKNQACIDGYMSTDNGAYKCPVCTRLDTAWPEWTGPVEYWSDEEMAARLKDRKDVYFDREYRYRRGLEVVALLKSLTGGPVKPLKEDGWGSEAEAF